MAPREKGGGLDEIDHQLLTRLREDARQNVSRMAQLLGVSRGNVYARIARLEKAGIIEGYTVRIGASYERRQIRAHIMMKIHPKLVRETERALGDLRELSALHSISGEYDLIAMIEAASTEALNEIIDHIGELDGVAKTTSSIVLATKVQR